MIQYLQYRSIDKRQYHSARNGCHDRADQRERRLAMPCIMRPACARWAALRCTALRCAALDSAARHCDPLCLALQRRCPLESILLLPPALLCPAASPLLCSGSTHLSPSSCSPQPCTLYPTPSPMHCHSALLSRLQYSLEPVLLLPPSHHLHVMVDVCGVGGVDCHSPVVACSPIQ